MFADAGFNVALGRVFANLNGNDTVSALEWMRTPNEVLDGQTPVEALDAGRYQEVVEASAAEAGCEECAPDCC